MSEKEDILMPNIPELQKQCDYLRTECDKLNTELRELASENKMLKETIVKMAMKQTGISE